MLTDPLAIIAFWYNKGGFWSLQLANGEQKNAYLQANSLITHFLLVLNFKDEDLKKRTAIIVRQSIGAQSFRQLLVHLRHNKLVSS